MIYPTYIFAISNPASERAKALRYTVTIEEIDLDYFITIDFPFIDLPYARKGKFTPKEGFLFFNENDFKRLATLYIEDSIQSIGLSNTINNEPYRVEVIETLNPTPPPVESTKTPEKVEEERLQTASNNQANLNQSNTTEVDAKQIENATPSDLKAMGIAKLPLLLLVIGNQVKKIIEPALKNLISTYIQKYLDTDSCPDAATLAKIRQQRDLIVGQLNKIGKTLNVITLSLTGVSTFLNILQGVLSGIEIAKIAAKAAAVAFPPLAAGLPTVLNTLNASKQTALIDEKGNSRLQKLTSIIGGAALVASIVGGFVLSAVALLKAIDAFLIKCDPNNLPTPISKEIQDIADAQLQADLTQNQSTYNGFIIEIETIPYTPTVNRKRAVGKNQSGIVLIQTELSFTNDDQVLINELKLIIDRDNLKAY